MASGIRFFLIGKFTNCGTGPFQPLQPRPVPPLDPPFPTPELPPQAKIHARIRIDLHPVGWYRCTFRFRHHSLHYPSPLRRRPGGGGWRGLRGIPGHVTYISIMEMVQVHVNGYCGGGSLLSADSPGENRPIAAETTVRTVFTEAGPPQRRTRFREGWGNVQCAVSSNTRYTLSSSHIEIVAIST